MRQKIGIILPTRGLVFTRVEQAIESFRTDYDITVYRSCEMPIPDGHNSLTEKALIEGCDYIFFVEEDTVPPSGALGMLLQANSDIACIDYGVAGWSCVTKNSEGEVLWCGLGCTLVKREVFDRLEKPYFRVDKVLRENDWTWVQLPEQYIKTKNYGTLDIWFCTQATKNGFRIVQVEGVEADHLELIRLGERGVNNGCHTIKKKLRAEKKQVKDIEKITY